MIKILAIDIGSIVLALTNLNVAFVHEPKPEPHARYVLAAFEQTLVPEIKPKIKYTVCGQELSVGPDKVVECVDYAIRYNYKYVLMPYSSSESTTSREEEIIRRATERGITLIFSFGNRVESNPLNEYPHSYCKKYPNCFIVYDTLRENKYRKNLPFVKGEEGKSCLNNACYFGSSFSAPKFLAKLINQRKE